MSMRKTPKSDGQDAVRQRVLRWRRDYGIKRLSRRNGNHVYVVKDIDDDMKRHIKGHEVALAYFMAAQRNGHMVALA